MEISHAVILGVIEGLTEFLPVSSTGHLIMAAQALKLPQTDFLKSFQIAIQLGAILSVLVLYFRKLLDRNMIKKLLAAFIPTAITGFIFYRIIKGFLLGSSYVVFWALLAGGVFLVIFELLHRERGDAAPEISAISFTQAFFIGLFQSIAIIPGVSRSAATIIGGLLLGIKRKAIVEFSFLLAVPTMLAATALDLSKNAGAFSRDQFIFLSAGFAASFVIALLAVSFFLAFIKKHNFMPFGIYRILAALLFLFLVR